MQEAFETSGLADLTSSTPIVLALGDGDVLDTMVSSSLNFTLSLTGPSVLREAAIDALTDAVPLRQAGPERMNQVLHFGHTLDVIVLDLESSRTPTQLLSPAQLDWLLETLSLSTATFKVVVGSVPISNVTSLIDSLGPLPGNLAENLFPTAQTLTYCPSLLLLLLPHKHFFPNFSSH